MFVWPFIHRLPKTFERNEFFCYGIFPQASECFHAATVRVNRHLSHVYIYNTTATWRSQTRNRDQDNVCVVRSKVVVPIEIGRISLLPYLTQAIQSCRLLSCFIGLRKAGEILCSNRLIEHCWPLKDYSVEFTSISLPLFQHLWAWM